MTTEVSSFLPYGKELTRADLSSVPDDGHRYELIDGLLIVSPAPRFRHLRMAFALARVLHGNCPSDHTVLLAPFDVVLADDTVIQPDLLVAPTAAFTETALRGAPLLAVEVLSPSTRGADLLLKKERLQRSGCQFYWVVDPDLPSVTAWALNDGTYAQAGQAVGAEMFEVTEPFPHRFTPAELLEGY